MDLLLDYFNLREMPFRLTPDERYFFGSAEHNRAVAHLMFGLAQGDGFVVITGEVGAGKTTLMERTLARINPGTYRPAVITTTAVDGRTLLHLIGAEFGIGRSTDHADFLMRIRERWRSDLAGGRRPIIVIDEAQALSVQALENLRLLSNLADGSKPLVQVVLLGQPEFRRTLAGPDLDQLRQRVLASYHLTHLIRGMSGIRWRAWFKSLISCRSMGADANPARTGLCHTRHDRKYPVSIFSTIRAAQESHGCV